MNNDPHGAEPRNPHVQHEPGDVNAKALTKFGLSMSALVLIFMFGLWGLFEFLKNRAAAEGQPFSRSALVNAQKRPPEPRLQRSPQLDLREWRETEEKAMNRYAWIDPDKGIVQIPVDRAMEIIAQRGLPAPAKQPAGKTQ